MTVLGETLVAEFARKHHRARKPLARFVDLAKAATWKHMPDIKATLPATDFDPESESYIFDVGGNKYRLLALIDFSEQTVIIESVMTHEE
jgi:mRNA interferase HigB